MSIAVSICAATFVESKTQPTFNKESRRSLIDYVQMDRPHALTLSADRQLVTTENHELSALRSIPKVDEDGPSSIETLEPTGHTEEDGRDASLSSIAEADFRLLEQAFHGIDLDAKARKKPAALTDAKRAENYAARRGVAADERIERLRRDDDRVATLRETVTLTVDDVAFLYAIGRDTVYEALKRPNSSIPHFRVGRRFIIPTRRVFEALGLE